MRQLSTEEQKIAKLIYDGHGPNLPTILDNKLQRVRICVQREPVNMTILFKINQETPTEQDSFEVVNRANFLGVDIITTVNLLKILQTEGYIILYERANNIDNVSYYGQGAEKGHSIKYRFPDLKIIELFAEYSSKDIIATPEFKRFVEHGYISRDEQRFQLQITTATTALNTSKRALRVSTTALIFAILIGLTNLLYNIFGKKNNPVKINEAQVNGLLQEVKYLTSRADTLIFLQKQQLKNIKKVSNTKKK